MVAGGNIPVNAVAIDVSEWSAELAHFSSASACPPILEGQRRWEAAISIVSAAHQVEAETLLLWFRHAERAYIDVDASMRGRGIPRPNEAAGDDGAKGMGPHLKNRRGSHNSDNCCRASS